MKSIIFLTVFWLYTLPLIAQTQITGTVVDHDNNPLEFAQIVGLNGDSIIVCSKQTSENGTFTLNDGDIRIINISAFGYEQKSISLGNREENLGTITLLPLTINLNEVVVTASVPITKLEGQAMVTNVSNSYLSQLGTANDILGWIPMVTSNDGEISVFGKGKPLIYINGRKVMNNSELELLSSNDIKNIKLITNPGPKYDASVKSVIIIQTKRPKGEGFGLNARLKGEFAEYFSPLGQIDLSYRFGGLDVGFVSYAAHDKKKYDSSYNQLTKLTSYIEETMNQGSINNQNEYIEKLTFNYEINRSNSIGGYYRLSLDNNITSMANQSDIKKMVHYGMRCHLMGFQKKICKHPTLQIFITVVPLAHGSSILTWIFTHPIQKFILLLMKIASILEKDLLVPYLKRIHCFGPIRPLWHIISIAHVWSLEKNTQTPKLKCPI